MIIVFTRSSIPKSEDLIKDFGTNRIARNWPLVDPQLVVYGEAYFSFPKIYYL